ncbi:glycine-rich cell wall structural protein-like [Raphanus sativus]|uniref:Glycine-rich cell wall structural protein-like n=1 Tax=Raphanus sativus TaxID=3726 RepID=A0A9W3C3G0_RAPSA|nr:glycine-rich cell wall structural protein-like [Raphanus sativus]
MEIWVILIIAAGSFVGVLIFFVALAGGGDGREGKGGDGREGEGGGGGMGDLRGSDYSGGHRGFSNSGGGVGGVGGWFGGGGGAL